MAPCGTTHFQVCGLQLYGQCKRQELISKEIMFTFNHWYILFVGNKIIMEVGGSGGGGDTLHMAGICVALKKKKLLSNFKPL